MPAKKKVDYKKLLEAVQSGKPQAEIIKQFKFNTATQFKNHYLQALMESWKGSCNPDNSCILLKLHLKKKLSLASVVAWLFPRA
jgi:hypothetical protein